MIMYNINMLMFVSHSDGFGINTDVFETNILNLSVVIGVLVYYGRAAFTKRLLSSLSFCYNFFLAYILYSISLGTFKIFLFVRFNKLWALVFLLVRLFLVNFNFS